MLSLGTMVDLPTYLLLGIADATTLSKVREAVVLLIALILSVTVHEYGHAIAADKLGDSTPRRQGRVTLNPIAHADLLGTVIFPIVGLFLAGGMLFGWGRPVLVNPLAFTRKLRMKTSHLLVAAAGPAMNIVLAIAVTLVAYGLVAFGAVGLNTETFRALVLVIHLNWILFLFNLLPCPPLDGGTVLAGILPDNQQHIIGFLQQYGYIILLGLLMTPLLGYWLIPAGWLTSWCVNMIFALALG